MIRRVGEPEEVSGIDSLCVWRVALTEAPGREWRHAFLEQTRSLGVFHDTGLRLAEATVTLQLERSKVRAALEHLDRCAAEANAACGFVADDLGADPGPETAVVLVVDDQSAIVTTIAEMLTLQGYSVLEATDPREALRMVRSQQVDLLLTDVVMPAMGGADLAKRVLEVSPRTRTVFMSAYAVEEVLTWGAPFLSKPFTYDSLSRTVRTALDRQSPFSRVAPTAPSPFSR